MRATRPHGLSVAVAALAAVGATASLTLAAPTETGIHQIHAAARYGGKWCFVTHEHEGDGAPFPSRHVALASAIRKWVVFTADEYGTAWGSYEAAIAKKVACQQQADKYWKCSVLARPCRSSK